MSVYSLIVVIIIIIYAFTFIRMRKNRKETKDIDSVRDFHKKYSSFDDMHRRNYDHTDNDIKESSHISSASRSRNASSEKSHKDI